MILPYFISQKFGRLTGTVFLTVTLMTTTAYGQTARETYEADYFSQFSARTALEMVERLPGFQLEEADEDRGLGQGGANVLFNGAVLTGKGEKSFEQIERIPAADVERIDILEASALDIPGLTGQVANVVTRTKGVSGTWFWAPEFRIKNEPAPFRGGLTVSGQKGNVQYTAGLKLENARGGVYGPETLSDKDGVIYETRNELREFKGERPSASLSLIWEPLDGHKISSVFNYSQFNFRRPQLTLSEKLGPRGLDGQSLLNYSKDEKILDADVDYQFPLGIGSLKLIGSLSQTEIDQISFNKVYDNALGQVFGIRYEEDILQGEKVARAEYGWSGDEASSWQVAGEYAFNFLKLKPTLINGIDAGPLQSITRPRSRVEENRGEVTLTHRRALSDMWNMQASIGAEYSEISVGQTKNSYERPKGFLLATYTPSENRSWDVRIAREVGQLNFRDFSAAVEIEEDLETGANADLVPPQSWVFSTGVKQNFSAGHALRANLKHEIISDLVGRVPFGPTGDAVGNIDKATSTELSLTGTLKSEPWGLKGIQIDAGVTLRDSELDDPITGISRKISNQITQLYTLKYRHDIDETPWAYGLSLTKQSKAPQFRPSVISTSDYPTPFSSVFIEHKDVWGMKVALKLTEIFDREWAFDQTFYAGRRDVSEIDRIESRVWDYDGPYVEIKISDTF